MMRSIAYALIVFGASITALGCSDPVHDAAVDALGPEAAGVRNGPLHRPGQPCLVCHGGSGPGGDTFSIAGTVYQHADGAIAAVSAVTTLVDAAGATYHAETNCAGNFFVEAEDFTPAFPVHVSSVAIGSLGSTMTTHIGRDGSCASCHTGAAELSTVTRVYLTNDASAVIPSGSCQ